MPRNVKRFAWLWVIAFTMQFPAVLLMPQPDPDLGLTRSAAQVMSAGFGLLLLAVLLPILALAVWKRKNWARWLLFGLFVIFLPFLFLNHAFSPDHLPETAVGITSQSIEAAAFYFVFTGDARRWFRPEISN